MGGGTISDGNAINNSGQVAGTAVDATGAQRAFLHDGTTMRDLGTLGGRSSVGNGIDASGQVVGGADTATTIFDAVTFIRHAFLYDGTAMRDLGTLGGNNSTANAINAIGQIVGTADTVSNSSRAFLFDSGTMYDLTTLVSPGDPLFGQIAFTNATGINDNGQIIANIPGLNSAAYLLTPVAATVPEPGTLAILSLGVLGVLRARRGVATRGTTEISWFPRRFTLKAGSDAGTYAGCEEFQQCPRRPDSARYTDGT